MSRETLPDVVKRAIFTERSPPAIRTHLSVNAQTLTRYVTVRAAIEAFRAVGRKWRQDQSGPAPMDVDAMTRKGKGKRWQEQRQGQGWQGQGERKQQEQGHGERERSAETVVNGRHGQKDCWSKHGKQVNSVETATADPPEVSPPSQQTPVPAAALTCFVPQGLLDDQWNEGWIMTISKQSSYPAQHELSKWTEIFADSGAAEHVRSEHHFPGAPIRPASRVVLRNSGAVSSFRAPGRQHGRRYGH